MPIYEYRCPDCKFEFEIRQHHFNEVLTRCPKCKASAKRLLSKNYITFGWRLTDRSHERFGPKNEVERNV